VSDAALAERITAACRARTGDAVELLSELAARDAPSGEPALLDGTARLLEGRLGALEARLNRIPTPVGTHIEARVGEGDRPAVLVLGHYDTVWGAGNAAARPFRVADGIATGPGVFDMRAGIAASLTALAVLRELGELRRPVAMLLTADEETGSVTSENDIVRIGRDVPYVLIPEPPVPGGGLKTRRKGVVTYALEIRGRASHAGLDPERGVSAISELAGFIGELEAAASPAAGTTVNVGVVSGGTRSNVVAAEARAEVDIRVATMPEYDRVIGFVEGLQSRRAGASVSAQRLHARPPMERTDSIAQAFGRATTIAGLAGLSLGEGSAGGASDGNFLAPLGRGVLDGLGPDGGGAHALDEHVVVESLEARVVLLALLMTFL
jgi:glutamate carboxypeptidase